MNLRPLDQWLEKGTTFENDLPVDKLPEEGIKFVPIESLIRDKNKNWFISSKHFHENGNDVCIRRSRGGFVAHIPQKFLSKAVVDDPPEGSIEVLIQEMIMKGEGYDFFEPW